MALTHVTNHYSNYKPGGYYSTSLHVGGDDERQSAKQRRKENYKADLQLQMQERNAAKQRERLQDMSVNASGYLDPEKGPERLKPLGGIDWTQHRSKGDAKVRPYHTLFLYDQQKRQKPVVVHHAVPPRPAVSVPVQMVPQVVAQAPPPTVRRVRIQGGYSPRAPDFSGPVFRDPVIRERFASSDKPDLGTLDPPRQVNFRAPRLDAPPQIHSHVPQYHDAYNIMAARDITMMPQAPLVAPLQPIHYGSSRPIIIQQPSPSYEWHGPRYNPYPIEVPAKNTTLLLPSSKYRAAIDKPLDDLDDKLEEARLKIKLERDNEEYKRRMQRELDENQRRLRESEAEARRRLEELRLESENRRREAERQRREWERLLRLKELDRPRTNPVIVKPGSGRNRLLDEMDLYRHKLREERKMIEELLMNRKPIEPPKLDIKVVRHRKEQQITRREIPPTPMTDDNANPDNVHTFSGLKQRDFESRRQFRSVYPEVPFTNKKLEWQQGALLAQQEEALRALREAKTDTEKQVVMKKYFFDRPVWMDREITPFGRMKKRGYTTTALEVEARLSRLDRDGFRSYRPGSADTLCDDTWIRPSSADV